MRWSIATAIASTAKGFLHLHHHFLKNSNPGIVLSPSLRFRFWVRAFSGTTIDYREVLRSGLHNIKFDDAFHLFVLMAYSYPLPSIVEFNKVLTAIAKMQMYDVVINLWKRIENAEDDEAWY